MFYSSSYYYNYMCNCNSRKVGEQIKMNKIVKDVLSGKKRNCIKILNCPHCQSVLVPSQNNYFEYNCFECKIIWEIKISGELN